MNILNRFYDGNVGILIDKEKYEEIKEIAEIIEPLLGDMRTAFEMPVLDYLLDASSGPVHYIDYGANCLNGGDSEYLQGYKTYENFEVIKAYDFLKACKEGNLKPTTIEEDDFLSLIGVNNVEST